MQQRPSMEIEINGHRSIYYFRPRISYDPRESAVAFIPHFGSQQLDIDFPPAFFLKGENRLILTCVDENVDVSHSIGSIATGISGLHYDALKLTEDTGKPFSPKAIQATVSPTVFYKQKGERLVEQVEVLIRLNQSIANGQVFLDTIPVTADELRTRVRAARETDEDIRAVIAADGRIAYAKVVLVIDILRQEHITKFAINVRPEEIGR